MEPVATADEPVPLKAISNNSVSGDDVITAVSNGAIIGSDSSMQVLLNGHNGAANAADVSSDLRLTSL